MPLRAVFECLVNSEVFQTRQTQLETLSMFECLVNSEVFQTDFLGHCLFLRLSVLLIRKYFKPPS